MDVHCKHACDARQSQARSFCCLPCLRPGPFRCTAFLGRAVFEWLLILPLAAPGYVIAYAWADLTGIAGPLQGAVQDMTGLSARDYWFPEVTGLFGTSFVLACALYPYVYLTARAAFTTQSASALEAARSLGASPWRTFIHVAVPGARPAIAAGLALALMEAAADYGAADFLGLQTLTIGVVRAKDSFGDVGIASAHGVDTSDTRLLPAMAGARTARASRRSECGVWVAGDVSQTDRAYVWTCHFRSVYLAICPDFRCPDRAASLARL